MSIVKREIKRFTFVCKSHYLLCVRILKIFHSSSLFSRSSLNPPGTWKNVGRWSETVFSTALLFCKLRGSPTGSLNLRFLIFKVGMKGLHCDYLSGLLWGPQELVYRMGKCFIKETKQNKTNQEKCCTRKGLCYSLWPSGSSWE